MRKATLLYNPFSGGRPKQRIKDIESAAKILTDAGVQVVLEATREKSAVVQQVCEARAGGCDVVFACGGDGTIHDVLQGLVGTDIALGIIPLGTANTLAHDLGIPRSPVGAAKMALRSQPKRIAVGVVEYKNNDGQSVVKYFTVALGIGMDAHLFYKLNPGVKRRLGVSAYYAMAWHLWFSRRIEYFVATCDHRPEQYLLTQLLAVRIRNFGGVLRELAPGASLDRNDLRLVLCQTHKRLAFLSYVFRGMLGANWRVSGIELLNGSEVTCDYPSSSVDRKNKIYIEADGELLGTLPAKVTVRPNALTLLVPS